MCQLPAIVALFLFCSCISASSFCIHGHCHPARPSNCLPVTTAPPRMIRRRLGPVANERHAEYPARDSPLDIRGLGICHFINGGNSEHLVAGVPSQSFVLPAGTYILKWAEGFTQGPAADIIGECLLKTRFKVKFRCKICRLESALVIFPPTPGHYMRQNKV